LGFPWFAKSCPSFGCGVRGCAGDLVAGRLEGRLGGMRVRGFTMKLKPGCAEEYRRRHDALWPELAALLRESGISDYAIFLDRGSNTLFAVQKLGPGFDPEALRRHPLMRRWWEYMADLMEVHPDKSPVEGELELMFHLP